MTAGPFRITRAEWIEMLQKLEAVAVALEGKKRRTPTEVADLAVRAIGLLWPAMCPRMVVASCRASLLMGQPVLAGLPPAIALRETDEVFASLVDEPMGWIPGALPLELEPEKPAKKTKQVEEKQEPVSGDWLTIAEVAELFSVNKNTAMSWLENGQFGAEGEGWRTEQWKGSRVRRMIAVDAAERLLAERGTPREEPAAPAPAPAPAAAPGPERRPLRPASERMQRCVPGAVTAEQYLGDDPVLAAAIEADRQQEERNLEAIEEEEPAGLDQLVASVR